MKTLLLATAFAAAFVLPAASCPAPAVCVVADPTGTPLNVRSAPNGTILGALHNDTPVQITGFTTAGKSGRASFPSVMPSAVGSSSTS